jgi:ferrochelatase
MIETAVILLNMGGPQSSDEVRPFLKALFDDPMLIRLPLKSLLAPLIAALRTPKVRERYAKIEGGSPLTRITLKQAERLEKVLNGTESTRFRVLVGMRYTSPSIAEALDEAERAGCRKIIALSMYPQYCSATTGSSMAELRRSADDRPNLPRVEIIDRYFDRESYLEALASTVRSAMKDSVQTPFVLFSAHGVPERLIRDGDPYVAETKATVSGVVKRLDLPIDRWRLTFQSRVGPVRWVEPSSERTVSELGASGVRDLVIVPVSFTADNIETLYDIEVVLTGKAGKAGIPRVAMAPALNADPLFITALAELVREAASD